MSYWTRRRTIHANVEQEIASIIADSYMSDDVVVHEQVDNVVVGLHVDATPRLHDGLEQSPVELCVDDDDDDDGDGDGNGDDGLLANRVDDSVDGVSDISFDYGKESFESGSDDDSSYVSIGTLLCNWYVTHSVSLNCFSDLLDILRPHFIELPKDPRTLLKAATPKCDLSVQNVSKGSYYHFGIQNGVSMLLDKCSCTRDFSYVSVQLNIDGVPLFKSTNGQFWPVLGKLELPVRSEPFVVGLFYGESKPSNLDFLTDVIAECKLLQRDGIEYGEQVLDFNIHSVICDAPARAFVKNIKGHASYSACERCTVSGVWEGKMTFCDIDAPKRTDVAFDELQDPDHHHDKSPVSELGIGMVSQFVLDYMHLICLGVVRRLIWLWLSGPIHVHTRLGTKCVNEISEMLIRLRVYIPSEFARKPRALVYWQRWKATEFRQFLLYTGPVVLYGKVSDAVYNNFMLLSVGMFLLLNKDFCTPEFVDYAEKLLRLFVQHFSDLYGSSMVVYNVHNVIHLADDVRKYGPLDSVSAFCFENFLRKITRLVRKPSKPLEQVVRRLLEQRQYSREAGLEHSVAGPYEEHQSGCVPTYVWSCRQYKCLRVNNLLLSIKSGDNCIVLGDDICLLRNILVQNSETLFVYEQFDTKRDFFEYPLKSSSINIYFVSNLNRELRVCSITCFRMKNVLLPFGDGYVVVPLLHC